VSAIAPAGITFYFKGGTTRMTIPPICKTAFHFIHPILIAALNKRGK